MADISPVVCGRFLAFIDKNTLLALPGVPVSAQGTVRQSSYNSDNSILVFSMANYRSVGKYETHGSSDPSTWTRGSNLTVSIGNCRGCAFHPNDDSRVFIGLQSSAPYLKSYNPSDWTPYPDLDVLPQAGVDEIVFNHAGTLMAVCSDQTDGIFIYDTSDWSLINTGIVLGSSPLSAAFSSDDSALAIGVGNNDKYKSFFTSDWSDQGQALAGLGGASGLDFCNSDSEIVCVSTASPYLHAYVAATGVLLPAPAAPPVSGAYSGRSNNEETQFFAADSSTNIYIYNPVDWSRIATTDVGEPYTGWFEFPRGAAVPPSVPKSNALFFGQDF